MLKLYMYQFYGCDIVQKHIFEVEPASERTAYCFIPKGWTYSSFYGQYNVYPPCKADLNIIPEIADKNGKYTMFSLENNDKKYAEELRKAIDRVIEEQKKKIRLLELDRDGNYSFFEM